jgi:hypothetical protein
MPEADPCNSHRSIFRPCFTLAHVSDVMHQNNASINYPKHFADSH